MLNDQTSEPSIVCYDYSEDRICLWFSNRDVVEYTVEDVGKNVLAEMKKLADSGRGLMSYIARSKLISAVEPRRWKEWL